MSSTAVGDRHRRHHTEASRVLTPASRRLPARTAAMAAPVVSSTHAPTQSHTQHVRMVCRAAKGESPDNAGAPRQRCGTLASRYWMRDLVCAPVLGAWDLGHNTISHRRDRLDHRLYCCAARTDGSAYLGSHSDDRAAHRWLPDVLSGLERERAPSDRSDANICPAAYTTAHTNGRVPLGACYWYRGCWR